MNGEFNKNLKIVGNRIVISPYINHLNNGTYVCKAYYGDAYNYETSSSSIYINRPENTDAETYDNYEVDKMVFNKYRITFQPLVELLPYITKNFIKVDCKASTAKGFEPNSIEWIRIQEDMSERTYIQGNSLIINK